jgi:hypothetical protein
VFPVFPKMEIFIYFGAIIITFRFDSTNWGDRPLFHDTAMITNTLHVTIVRRRNKRDRRQVIYSAEEGVLPSNCMMEMSLCVNSFFSMTL